MEEILCCIGAAIFSILAVVFGVRRNTKLGAGGCIRNSRERLDNIIHDHKRLRRNKDRIQELGRRDAGKLKECSRIGKRIRKREQKADNKK